MIFFKSQESPSPARVRVVTLKPMRPIKNAKMRWRTSLKYEAAMLKAAAAGPGDVKLVAIDDLSTNNGGPPVMLIEFMHKEILFRELNLAYFS